MKFRVEVKLGDTLRDLPGLHTRIRNRTVSELKRSVSIANTYASVLAPKDTGALASNISHGINEEESRVVGYVRSEPIAGVPYNVYQEYGIGQAGASGKIHERAKSSLKDTVTPMSYSSIKGFGAQPYMYPTARLLSKMFDLPLIYEEELRKWIRLILKLNFTIYLNH